MRDADRAFGLVDMLAAGAGRAVGVDLQVTLTDVDIDVLVDHRIDPDRRETCMPPCIGIERADADQAVYASLGLEPAIGIWSTHLKRRRLDAGLLALALFQ